MMLTKESNMSSTTSIDKAKLLELLKVNEEHKAFRHGQLRRAVSHVIREYGYQWAMLSSGPITQERIDNIQFRYRLRNIVFESTRGWHSNKSVVWGRFKSYAKNVGSRHEAIKIIKKAQLALNN